MGALGIRGDIFRISLRIVTAQSSQETLFGTFSTMYRCTHMAVNYPICINCLPSNAIHANWIRPSSISQPSQLRPGSSLFPPELGGRCHSTVWIPEHFRCVEAVEISWLQSHSLDLSVYIFIWLKWHNLSVGCFSNVSIDSFKFNNGEHDFAPKLFLSPSLQFVFESHSCFEFWGLHSEYFRWFDSDCVGLVVFAFCQRTSSEHFFTDNSRTTTETVWNYINE